MAGMDAFAPVQIADLVRTRGVAKAEAGVVPTFVLGVIAGAFIALGGVLATTVATGSSLGFGPGATGSPGPTFEGSLTNLIASTLGNVAGGALLVGLVYWFVYLRPQGGDT
jgi:formate/nitrite transporter FocA (FNT family)